ncbi:MAG TPA: undecaprenyl-diphosphate phosphatase [Longimicrobiales bacterium]|nr:undecaprenyl-diphosphate phosphatase [Longimicrobiales bacterium]
MSFWEAILLGVVQGATEFLPVSSSGHLVIAQELLDVHIGGVLFEIAVHLATLVSILLVYRARVAGLVAGVLRREQDAWGYVALLGLATLPAAALGVLARDPIEALFESPVVPGVALLVTGALLWTTRGVIARATLERPGVAAALLVGVAQAFALVPGISRSGSTVVAALWLGIRAPEAAAFSFLMAVPAIGGAAVLQLPGLTSGTGPGTGALVAGGVAAGVTGVLAIRTFVAMLEKRSFHAFAPYCWVVGSAFLAYLLLR